MAHLTANDILNKQFTPTRYREGYDLVEVDDFLDEVVQSVLALEQENAELKSQQTATQERISELHNELSAAQQALEEAKAAAAAAPAPVVVKAPEPTPEPVPAVQPAVTASGEPEAATGMLQLAQRLHDEYVNNGQQEGERLIHEARLEGERIVREAEDTSRRTLDQLERDKSLLERKIDELRIFERDYRKRLSGYLQGLLGDLDAAENNPEASTPLNRTL